METIYDSTEDKRMFRREVRRFLEREAVPSARDRWRSGAPIPRDLWKRIAAQGFLQVNVPADFGGTPADWVTVGILVEELGRADFQLYHPLLMVHLAWMSLAHASDDLARQWMPGILSGDRIISLGLTEANAGSDAAALQTRATRDGDDYVLSGEKVPVTQGMDADASLVFAKTDPAAGARGVTCFLVPHDLPGVGRTKVPFMGFEALPTATLSLDDVRVPASLRVGKEGEGFYIVMRDFDVARVILGLAALGAAQASLDEAIAYARQRQAFGGPIARFQAVSHKIAHHATAVLAARMLCYHALWLRDQGRSHTMESAMAKFYAINETAVPALHDAMLVHGQVGYSYESNLPHRLKDVLGLEIGDGTSDIQKLVVARELIGRESLPYG